MKRLIPLALLATAALAVSATPSFAGAFGLFYWGRCCDCCCGGVNLRPVNAFTPICCGIGEFSGGCGSKWCGKLPCPWGSFGCDDCVRTVPFFAVPFCKKSCCYQDGIAAPGAPAVLDAPVAAPTGVATYFRSTAPAGMMPPSTVQPVSYNPAIYPPAYPAYPVYPMGYAPAPVWGGYPMPASYPAPASPNYWYPMGR
jgi:hypothetical protein